MSLGPVGQERRQRLCTWPQGDPKVAERCGDPGVKLRGRPHAEEARFVVQL